MKLKQKIIFGFLATLFIIPELLWSPLGNAIFSITAPMQNGSVQFLRPNFLTNIDNTNWLSSILLVQFLGLLMTEIYLLMSKNYFEHKGLFWILASLLAILIFVVFIIFGLSVSLRNIGF